MHEYQPPILVIRDSGGKTPFVTQLGLLNYVIIFILTEKQTALGVCCYNSRERLTHSATRVHGGSVVVLQLQYYHSYTVRFLLKMTRTISVR